MKSNFQVVDTTSKIWLDAFKKLKPEFKDIFYDPKFIKLKPAIKKTISHTIPLIRKKVKPPTKMYLPHLLFDTKFLNLVLTDINI